MKIGTRTASGLVSYDRAQWSGWIPELSRVHHAGGLGSLLQTTPPGAIGPGDVNVPPLGATALLFWTNGSRHDGIQSRIDGRNHRLRPRKWQYTILPPDCPSWWLSTPSDSDGVFHLHFNQDLMISIADTEHCRGAVDPAPLGDDTIIVRMAGWLFEAMHRGTPSRLFWDTAAATIALRLLSLPLKRDRTSTGGLAPWQVRRVTECLDAHLADDIPLAALAQLVGLSPNHFCTAFRVSVGEPPHRYLVRRRIQRAKELLSDPRLSVTDVALAVGFGSSAHFATAFRKDVGVAPSAYRRERSL